jgi:putative DNA primase/helicase
VGVISEIAHTTKLNMFQLKTLTCWGSNLTAKLILLADSDAQYRAASEGGKHCLALVPLTASFVNVAIEDGDVITDPDMMNRLATEEGRSALLRWLVEGAQQWYRDGLGELSTERSPSPNISAPSALPQDATVSSFIEEGCLTDPDSSIQASVLYSAYKQWCANSGLKTLSSKAFGEQIGQRYKRKKSGCVYYLGITTHP